MLFLRKRDCAQVHSSALLGAFVAGTAFCFLPDARAAWADAVAPLQAPRPRRRRPRPLG